MLFVAVLFERDWSIRPHLLEATGSHCVGSPIEQAVKGAFADGIGVYWR